MGTHKPIFAIDPGTFDSAWVIIDDEGVRGGILNNHELIRNIRRLEYVNLPLAIEMIASYGKPVGSEVFETCAWIGRFEEAWITACGSHGDRVYRKDVKMNLCYTVRGVNDAVIRQALIDRFGPGKERAVGLKKSPGPLYGFKKDMWAALGVAVTWQDRNKFGGEE